MLKMLGILLWQLWKQLGDFFISTSGHTGPTHDLNVELTLQKALERRT